MLLLSIKYSMHDLATSIIIVRYSARLLYASYNVNDVSTASSFGICKLWIPQQNQLLDAKSYKNLYFIYLFQVFITFNVYTLILPV